jgi:hypothetical protein
LELQQHLLLRRIDQQPNAAELKRQLHLSDLDGPEDHDREGSTDGWDLDPDLIGSLVEIAAPPGDSEELPVAPLEKLQLLVALSKLSPNGLTALPDDQRAAAELVASGLLEEGASDADAATMLEIIDAMDSEHGVIRVRGLTEDLHVAHVTGPTAPPTELGKRDTIGDVIRNAAVAIGKQPPQLRRSLAEQSVVDVEARIYRALVNGQAEFPVHIRTTIRFPAEQAEDFPRFQRILEPDEWPNYNSFWQAMDPIDKQPRAGGAAVPAAVLSATDGFNQSLPQFAAGWEKVGNVGTYEEKVGFSQGENLYQGTYLYFARRGMKKRSLLSYTLVDRTGCELGVDDGCLELTISDDGIDVATSKSLYVSGAGEDSEVAGILAYMAVYLGWGGQTLALVEGAVDS